MHTADDLEFVREVGSKQEPRESTLGAEEKPVLRPFGQKTTAGIISKVTPKMSRKMAVASGVAIVGVGAVIAWPMLHAAKAPAMEVKTVPDDAPVKAKPFSVEHIDFSTFNASALEEPQTLEDAKNQIQMLKSKVAYMDQKLEDVGKKLDEKMAATEQVLNQANAASSPALPASSPLQNSPENEKTSQLPIAPASGQGEGGGRKQSASQSSAKTLKRPAAKPVSAPVQHKEEFVQLAVLEINAERVIVSDESRPDVKIGVSPGGELPGGAIYIGFDPETRLMKTNQGEFVIP